MLLRRKKNIKTSSILLWLVCLSVRLKYILNFHTDELMQFWFLVSNPGFQFFSFNLSTVGWMRFFILRSKWIFDLCYPKRKPAPPNWRFCGAWTWEQLGMLYKEILRKLPKMLSCINRRLRLWLSCLLFAQLEKKNICDEVCNHIIRCFQLFYRVITCK